MIKNKRTKSKELCYGKTRGKGREGTKMATKGTRQTRGHADRPRTGERTGELESIKENSEPP